MKTIFKAFLTVGVAVSTLSMTSCIDETNPTSGATDEQLSSSSKATEALLWAMPAYLNALMWDGDYGYDWGYGSILHVRDIMTEDMCRVSSGYDWYTRWAVNQYQSEDYIYNQYLWNYYNKLVQTSNNVCGALNPETASDAQLGYLAAGKGYRAMAYLDMARMFEFLPSDVNPEGLNAAGNCVINLTVPIVTEATTEDEARHNPRATREEMFTFILSDLDWAEKYIELNPNKVKTLPDLTAIYGLKARLYMWVEDYVNAEKYARLAINAGDYVPTSKADWLSTTTGFNTLNCSSWVWGAKAMKDDDCVKTGILNWTSWMSNETTFGYAAAEPFTMIGAAVYNRINDLDFRKLSYKAPEGHPLAGKEPYVDADIFASLPAYAGLKFRPSEGNISDYAVAAASAFPLMRIEEMYLIEAEAAAHQNAANGKALLEAFMTTYRYPEYVCNVTEQDAVIEEIVFQKRVELWGEGQTFYDIKRLNYSVDRVYEGSNFQAESKFETNGRPAWMSIPIVKSEKNNNDALIDWENPDPSDAYEVKE